MSTDTSSSSSSSSNVRLLLTIVGLAGVLIAGAFAWINERGDDAVVASIGDQELTAGQLGEILGSLPEGVPGPDGGSIGKTVPTQLISTWLRVAALRAELDSVGYGSTDQDEANAIAEVSDPTLDLSSPYGEYVVSVVREVQALERYVADSVDPTEIEPPEYICSSHILLDSEQDALDVITLLDEGRDFAELAMEFSIGPSGPNGGDLGCVPTQSFVTEFIEAAREFGVGITPPVQTQFGFHVIDVRSFGPLSTDVHPEMDAAEVEARMAAAADEASSAVTDPIRDEFQRAAFARLADADVDSRYGYWDEASQSVLPVRS